MLSNSSGVKQSNKSPVVMPERSDVVWDPELARNLPLDVHKAMLARGLLVVKPKRLSSPDCQPPFSLAQITQTSFPLNNRHLQLSSASVADPHYRAKVRARQKRRDRGHKTSAMGSKQERLLAGLLTDTIERNPKIGALCNTKRKQEIFYWLKVTESALSLRDVEPGAVASLSQTLFAHPWVTKTTDSENYRFSCYVTAGCLFGSNLEGEDRIGYRLSLVKHDKEFWPQQRITGISYDADEPNPYERLLFQQLITYCKIIKHTYLPTSGPVPLFFHVPSTDYALYGIELFIRGRMTERALCSFLSHIAAKYRDYKAIIRSIVCRFNERNDTNIQLKILSPFDSIFNFSDVTVDRSFNPESALQSILDVLGPSFQMSRLSSSGDVDTSEQGEKAKEFVTRCVQLLKDTSNTELSPVWHKFINVENTRRAQQSAEPISTLEDLFRIANAVVIGVATFNRKDNEVCSLLPVSEKQIQVEYSRLCKQTKCPSALNITTLDPVVQFGDRGSNIPFNFAVTRQLSRVMDALMPRDVDEACYRDLFLCEEEGSGSVSDVSVSSPPVSPAENHSPSRSFASGRADHFFRSNRSLAAHRQETDTVCNGESAASRVSHT